MSGDTIRLKGGKTVRYIGIAAPPLQSRLPLLRQYGEEARDFNSKLVAGKTVQVEWDSQIRDQHNNLLGYVFLEDGTFVNEALAREGHAKAYPLPPNMRLSAAIRKAELEARRQKKGLWKEEPDNPYIRSEFIGDKNTKLYYFPTSPELERIAEAHTVKFRSRVDAKAAGYRACPTCKEEAEPFL